MLDRDLAEFNSAVEMRDYAAANNDDFKDNPTAVALIASINQDIAELTASGAARITAVGERSDGTLDKRTAKAALYALVKHIAANGRTIKKMDPTFDNTFILPKGSNIGYQQLIEVSESFKNNLVGATLAKFTNISVDENIPVLLQNRMDDYNAARNQQNTGKSESVEATAETNTTITRLKSNRRILEQLGKNLYFSSPAKLAAWKSVCRLRKTGSSNTPPTPPPTP